MRDTVRQGARAAIWVPFVLCLASCASFAPAPGEEAPAVSAGELAAAPVGPMIKVQTGEAWRMNCVAFSPDGTRIMTGSDDQTIRIWDSVSGKELRMFRGHEAGVQALAVTPDGTRMVSGGSWDGSVRVWDIDAGTQVRSIVQEKTWKTTIAVSPDGAAMAAGDRQGRIEEWRLDLPGLPSRVVQASGAAGVNGLAYSPDGARMAAAMDDGEVVLWTLGAQGQKKATSPHKGKALCVTFSQDGAVVASGGEDGNVVVQNADTGQVLKEMSVAHAAVNGLRFLPDTTRIVSVTLESRVTVRDWQTGDLILTLTDPARPSEGWMAVDVARDGSRIVAGGVWGTLCSWDAAHGQVLLSVSALPAFRPHADAAAPTAQDTGILCVSWDIASLLDLGTARVSAIWDSTSMGNRWEWQPLAVKVSASGDPLLLVKRRDGGEMAVWDAAHGKVAWRIRGDGRPVERYALSPDGSLVAAGPLDGPLSVWQSGKSDPIYSLPSRVPFAICEPVFSSDGRLLASPEDRMSDGTCEARVWDMASGKLAASIPVPSIMTVAFSPDGKKLIIGKDGPIDIVDLGTLSKKTCQGGHQRTVVTAMVMSRDGSRMYSAGQDWGVCAWDVATGKVLTRFVGARGAIDALVLAAGESRLVSFGDDATVRAWNAATGELLYSTLIDSSGEYLAWTPEGYFGGSDRLARDLVYVQDGDQVSSIDQYHELLYRPDLVAAKGRDGKLPEGVAAASLARILSGDGQAPRVEIVEPAAGERDSRELVLKLRLVDRGGGIGKIVIALDGMPVVLSEGGRGLSVSGTGEAADKGMLLEARVSLRGGENLVEVSAYNKAGSVESARVSRSYRVPEVAAGKPRLAMLLVAVDKYRDGSLRLAHSVDDASSFAQSMTSAAVGLYREVSVQQLLDAEVTRAGFDGSFDQLAGTVSPEDVFLLYFAGHGVTNEEDGEYYFLPVDFRYRDRASIAEQGISKAVILDNLLKVKADKTILLFDTCNSGSFLATPASRGLSEKTAVDRLKRAIGRAMIVASSDTQVALEGYQGHGVFTWSLLEGIGGKADGDSNGYVSVKELSSWVESTVPDITYATWGYEQVPQSLLPREDFPLVPAAAR